MNTPITILVIDDDPFARSALTEYFSIDRRFVVLATGRDGLETIELAQEHNPDVIIMDIQMPRLVAWRLNSFTVWWDNEAWRINQPRPCRFVMVTKRYLRRWCVQAPQPQGQRARIVLLASQGVTNALISELVGASRPTVNLWRGRYLEHGLEGLVDIPRPGRPKVVDDAAIITATPRPSPEASGGDSLVESAAGCPPGGVPSPRSPRPGRSTRGPAMEGRHVQVLHRPGTGGQGHRRCRPVSEPAG